MSDILTVKKQIIEKEVVTGKTCDVCGKMIEPSDLLRPNPLYNIITHHYDWGSESVESFEYFHACSPSCALKFAEKYMNGDFEEIHTHTIEIQHIPGWKMPQEVKDEDLPFADAVPPGEAAYDFWDDDTD